MKILLTLCIMLFSSNLLAANAKVTDIQFEDQGKEGQLIIKLDKKVDDFPELLVKNNFVQVAIPDSFVWPKIDKKFSYQTSFDSKIMAYQFNKNRVRVRAVMPERMETFKDRVSLQLKGNTIVVNFPKTKGPSVAAVSKGRAPALAPNSKKALESKDPSVYDESYLEKLLKQKESAIEVKPIEKKAENTDLEKDTLKFKQAATKKETSGFSLTKYAGKFVGFLALVLLLFYGVVSLLKKGAFSKSKLGFLNSTKVVEVLNTTYIAPKRSLLMIRAHNQIFLVGSSEKGLHMISELKDTTGLLKEGEKQLSGTNFDSTLGSANEGSKEFKLKEFLNASDDTAELSSSQEDSIALRAIEKEMAAAKESHKVKFSDQIKSKIKDLKPLQ